MSTTTFFRRLATLLSTGLLLAHSANAVALQPKALLARDGSLLLRQQPCQKATLDVSEDKVNLCLLSAVLAIMLTCSTDYTRYLRFKPTEQFLTMP